MLTMFPHNFVKRFAILVMMILSLQLTAAESSNNHSHMEFTTKAKEMMDRGETYHKDVSEIRKMHPDFMNHKRDKTHRQGVRTTEYSLKGCVNCHGGFDKATGNAIRIDEKHQFCADCHKQVGVTMDCFTCHKATPRSDYQIPANTGY